MTKLDHLNILLLLITLEGLLITHKVVMSEHLQDSLGDLIDKLTNVVTE